MLTFDDGYFNNHSVVPLLNEYRVPAVFFLSLNHVNENKAFWWDVLYREEAKRTKSIGEINKEIEYFKSKTATEIDLFIRDKFGKKAFEPWSDLDRPFSLKEVKEISMDKYVVIGNHTLNHDILTNYSFEEAKNIVQTSQESVEKLIGVVPEIISYPTGTTSPQLLQIARSCGLRIGVTTNPKKNYFPIGDNWGGKLALHRFPIKGHPHSLMDQLNIIRSDITLRNFLRT